METNNNSNAQAPVSSAVPMTAQEKEQMRELVSRMGGWQNILSTLQAVEARKAQDCAEETKLCRMAAEKLGVDWRSLANKVCSMIAGICQPTLWNASPILQLALTYGLNPLIDGEIFAIKFGGGYQAIVGVNGIYRLVANDPRFVSVKFEYAENMIELGSKEMGRGFSMPLSAPAWCKCLLTIKKDNQLFTCEKVKWLSDCYRSSQAWKIAPAEMLAARAYWSIARCALGLGIGDEGAPEDPHWTDKAPAPSPAKPATQPQQVQVVQVSDELEDIL